MRTLFFAFAALLCAALPLSASAAKKEFRLYTVEVDGVKFWIPSTVIVKKGDRVKMELVSKVPGANSVHGFAIDAFKIQEIADTKGKTIEFVADQAGIFPFRCHMHPAHVGGQILVLE